MGAAPSSYWGVPRDPVARVNEWRPDIPAWSKRELDLRLFAEGIALDGKVAAWRHTWDNLAMRRQDREMAIKRFLDELPTERGQKLREERKKYIAKLMSHPQGFDPYEWMNL